MGLYASSQLELAVGMLQLHLAGDTLRCNALIGLRARQLYIYRCLARHVPYWCEDNIIVITVTEYLYCRLLSLRQHSMLVKGSYLQSEAVSFEWPLCDPTSPT